MHEVIGQPDLRDKAWAEKMQVATVHKLEAQSSETSVPEPAEEDLLGRNAASALAMKNLINMAGRHMIHDASETERRRLRRLLDSLTKQQEQCACWVLGGMTNKEIGHEIGRATRTVKSHLSKVYARLGLQHKSPFVKRAIMVKMMLDTSRHQESGAEMRQLFSPRQIDVLDLVSEGLKNKESRGV